MCINIGSSTRLKGFFVWIDEVREQHGLAAVAQIKQTQLAGRSKFNVMRSQDRITDTLMESPYGAILSLAFAAKL
jgi:hypothetical protein